MKQIYYSKQTSKHLLQLREAKVLVCDPSDRTFIKSNNLLCKRADGFLYQKLTEGDFKSLAISHQNKSSKPDFLNDGFWNMGTLPRTVVRKRHYRLLRFTACRLINSDTCCSPVNKKQSTCKCSCGLYFSKQATSSRTMRICLAGTERLKKSVSLSSNSCFIAAHI